MPQPSTDHPLTPPQGWVLFDADCGFCTRIIDALRPHLETKGLDAIPLQSDAAKSRLNLTRPEDEAELLKEMRVCTPNGEIHGGADAVVYLTSLFWWGKPLAWLSRLPGGYALLDRVYREIARRRHCSSGTCRIPKR